MRRIALPVLAVAAVAVTGCGDRAKKNDYVKNVNKVNATYTGTVTRLTSQVAKLSDPDKIADKFDAQADVLARAATDLGKIDPPEDAKAGHAKLVGGTKLIAEEFRTAADDARDGDVQKAVDELNNSKGAAEYAAGIKQLRTDAGIK